MIGEAEILDPVSGNDVPPGSLPEEVRDDIDARLSEGEYVVPADVVRYFGVKFFEDLRSQAKMGLQQMDADGRIGGDPVPAEQPQAQDDSMEIAQLKAELSQSGMYAGGLTDGNSLDNFIDDASRSPMVNGRMRAGGATVNMAVGGLAVGNYGDVTKVDGIIQKLMTAANKDPALMQKLASKGIKINNTSADKKSAEMQQANKPQEPTDPVKMQEGGLTSNDDLMATATKTNPFLQKFSTVGGTAFEPMLEDFEDMSDEDKAALEAFTDPSGVIKEVFLVDAEGNRFTVAWNTAMPVPEGFTLEEIPEGFNATEPVYPAGTVINPAVQTERRTGDEGPNFPEAFSTSGSTGRSGNLSTSGLSSAALIGIDTDYKNMKTEDLEATYEKLENRFGNSTIFGVVGSALLAGTGAAAFVPLLTTGSKLAAKKKKLDLEKEIVKRYAEAKEKAGSEYTSKNKFGFDRDSDEKNKYLDNEQGTLRKELDSLSSLYERKFAKSLKDDTVIQRVGDFLLQPFDAMLGRKEYTDIMEAAEAYQKQLDPAAVNASVSPNERTPIITAQSRDTGSERLFEQVRRDTAMGKAKRNAFESAKAQREADARKVAAANRTPTTTYNPNTGNTSTYVMNPDGTRGYTGGTSADGRSWSTGKAAADAQAARQEEREKGFEQQRSDFFSNLFDEGGLVAKPAAKKQKKRTTQRRKGLGTRP
jgi:hypothetical protein